MKLPLLRTALLALFALTLGVSAPPAQAQSVRAIFTSGNSTTGGGTLDITIETFGTYTGIQTDCKITSFVVSIPIPAPADCHQMTQAIFDVLSVQLAGVFEVTENVGACVVFLRRNQDPECTYFEMKLRGDWHGFTFQILDDPTPVKAVTWGWLKLDGWRRALRGEPAARPRR